MSDNHPKVDDIPLDDEDTQIFAGYEPEFSRVFARGTLLRFSEDDPDTLQVGFWTERDEGIELEDGSEGTGYRLETEAVMTWRTARRLRDLLDHYIEEHGPEEYSDAAASED